MRTTPDNIQQLQPNEVFVFGSNIQGEHVGGAARLAHQKFGATYGLGAGFSGQTYAIPTLNYSQTNSGQTSRLPIAELKKHVDNFIAYAVENKALTFLVTEIGCGIAGFTYQEIAPLFKNAVFVENIVLPTNFLKIISK